MKKLVVNVDESKDKNLLGKRVVAPLDIVVNSPTTVVDQDGRLLVVIDSFDDKDLPYVRSFLPHINYQNNLRLANFQGGFEQLRTSDMSFGYRPYKPLFGMPSGALDFNKKYANWFNRLNDMTERVTEIYETISSDCFNRHKTMAQDIRPEWLLKGGVFSQGIINNSVQHSYHYDRGNFKNTMSAMIVLKHKSTGGWLNLPALGVTLATEDSCIVFFDGQKILHGVTPIVNRYTSSKRFSIVWYTLAKMVNSLSADDEINKIRKTDLKKHRKNS